MLRGEARPKPSDWMGIVEYAERFGCGCSAETISPGAGKAGSLSWRFMRTVERRRAVLCGERVERWRVIEPTELPIILC